MQLPLQVRLKLLRQRALAALRIGGNRPVRILETAGGLAIEVDGRRIRVPSPLRWKLYRQGWTARLDRLEREYGVGRHVRLHPGDLVLDVGANAGEFAFVAERYGARIFCVEPDPRVFECLKANIAGLSGASAHDAVIWKEDGVIDFGLAPDRADSSVFVDGAPRIARPAVTILSFARDHGLAHIDFLKCDAEGAEPEVLAGAGAFLQNVRAAALDTGPERNGEATGVACGEILARAGFKVIHEEIGGRRMTYGINLRGL
ncbi:MAG: FkbM family methyltransferase [Parvularculaceae bacterium]